MPGGLVTEIDFERRMQELFWKVYRSYERAVGPYLEATISEIWFICKEIKVGYMLLTN